MLNRKLIAQSIGMLSLCVLSQCVLGAEKTLDPINSLAPAPLSKSAPNKPIIIPDAPKIDAKAFVLMDANSGNIIAMNNPDERVSPASLTKLMTLYVAFDALKNSQIKLGDKVVVSKKAWQTGGSRMFIQVGTEVSVADLLRGVIVASGNDAAVALAEHIGGSEDAFASLMNQEAKRLGLTGSHFVDCNGLPDPNHYTTARDMALLARRIALDFPEYYAMFGEKQFRFNNINQMNRNRLLWRYSSADGLKTGHTDDAGFCLVASAKQDGMRLISVVMGAPSDSSRASDSINLLTYGFRFFKTYQLYAAGQPITQARIWKGAVKQIPTGITQNFYVTIPVGQYEKLAANAALSNPINAPILKGQQIGILNVTLDNKPLIRTPLVALQDDPKGSLWSQMMDSFSHSLHNMISKTKTAATDEVNKIKQG